METDRAVIQPNHFPQFHRNAHSLRVFAAGLFETGQPRILRITTDNEKRFPSVFIRAIRGQNPLFFSHLCSEVKFAVNHS
jgi:hypothetical protein